MIDGLMNGSLDGLDLVNECAQMHIMIVHAVTKAY